MQGFGHTLSYKYHLPLVQDHHLYINWGNCVDSVMVYMFGFVQ